VTAAGKDHYKKGIDPLLLGLTGEKGVASRVVAQLRNGSNVETEIVRGGLGEFSVYIDGQKVIDTNRLWYPLPGNVVKRVQALIAHQEGGSIQ
jgi:hypothetical protein